METHPRLVISQHPKFDCQYKPGKCQIDPGGPGINYCIYRDKEFCPWRVEPEIKEENK